MTCEFGAVEFDIAAAAGWYSAVAGLLAGFAMLLPLDHETKDRGREADHSGSNAVIVFTSAFFSLLILSLTYAVLSGRPSTGPSLGVAAHEQQLNGAAMGLSSLLMLIGLHEVLRLYGGNKRIFDSAQNLIVRVTGLYGPIIVVAFQFSNALDVEAYRAADASHAQGACPAGAPLGVWVNLSIALAAIAALIVLAVVGRRMARNSSAAAIIGRATLGFTIGVAVWTAMIVPFLPVDVVTGAAVEHVTLALTAVGSVAFGAASWLSR